MQQPISKDLIKRYLKGNCTLRERALVKELMRNGEAKVLFDEVLDEHPIDDYAKTDGKQLEVWAKKFHEHLNASGNDNVKPIGNRAWLKYAAVLSFLMLTIGSYILLHKRNTADTLIAMQQTVNPNGKLVQIKLSDNTTVMLNAASKLKYPTHFNGKTREVYLEGEAFFDVAHDTQHPFIVHTSQLKVNVLGTSFNVKDYSAEKEIAITVATGKVGVITNGYSGKTYMLLPGQQLHYSIANQFISQNKVDLNEVAAWQSGMLIYHNETLENISRQMERWYDVKFNFKNEAVRHMRFSLKQKNDRLENVMRTLKFAGGIRYSIAGKTVSIW
ncbi:FecR family protein [Mucilaginibacter pineti]|uniref:FecR family protein n=2 Tax=Mucilaginibacter pineti TaxID=1391627 RepID=A0A1G6XI98_9SPHI|nr:FecR family protein [Mucilaginibacter pineti]